MFGWQVLGCLDFCGFFKDFGSGFSRMVVRVSQGWWFGFFKDFGSDFRYWIRTFGFFGLDIVVCWYKDVKVRGGMKTFSTKGRFCPTKERNARRAF
jgi:hypothetical protein